MTPSLWSSGELEVQRLHGRPPYRFDCGRPEQNEFLQRHAWEDQQEFVSATHLFYVDGVLAAYATLCMDALPLARDERAPAIRYGQVGALKLAQLGVHLSFQGRRIGSEVIAYVIWLARKANEQVGCRFVTLDAQPDLVDWYGRQGFLRNRVRQEQRVRDAIAHRRDPDNIAVSMRFDVK